MILHTFTLTLGSTRPIHGTAPELRGFFATKFTEYTELHQHAADTFIYRYPVVQYKMINNVPTVIGINEGAEVLKKIYDEYQEIRLGANTYQIVERGIALKDEEFGISDKIRSVRICDTVARAQPGELQEVLRTQRKRGAGRICPEDPDREHHLHVKIAGIRGSCADQM